MRSRKMTILHWFGIIKNADNNQYKVRIGKINRKWVRRMEMDGFTHAIEHIKADKIRITPQRRAIIRYLADSEKHDTAEDIYAALIDDYPNMSMATVYNTLNLLLDYNLVRQIRTDGSSAHYDFNVEEHYHIVCKYCGKIQDVYYPVFNEVNEELEGHTQFKIDKYNLEIIGICSECQKE